jgi:tryptophan synthase alpha chain
LRPLTAKPLAVGFGLSNAKQMRTVRPYVDGVIVGSALIQAIAGAPRPPFAKATRFVTALQHALNDREQVH